MLGYKHKNDYTSLWGNAVEPVFWKCFASIPIAEMGVMGSGQEQPLGTNFIYGIIKGTDLKLAGYYKANA